MVARLGVSMTREARILRACGGDRWLASTLERAIGLVRAGQAFTLVELPTGYRVAAGYLVRCYGLEDLTA